MVFWYFTELMFRPFSNFTRYFIRLLLLYGSCRSGRTWCGLIYLLQFLVSHCIVQVCWWTLLLHGWHYEDERELLNGLSHSIWVFLTTMPHLLFISVWICNSELIICECQRYRECTVWEWCLLETFLITRFTEWYKIRLFALNNNFFYVLFNLNIQKLNY